MTPVTPVIVSVPAQREKVKRLVDYIHALDGTVVRIIPKRCPERKYPLCNNDAFHEAARAMRGQAFIWLEPDSIPLKPGWVQALSAAYHESGKEFLLTSDRHPPFDLVGGIGVYGPDSHWLIPRTITKEGWDGWMDRQLAPLIAKTPLIQHSYGNYDRRGKATPHCFPQEIGMIRPDAVIFHADKQQGLIQHFGSPNSMKATAPNPAAPITTPARSKMRVFFHSGDVGDIVYSLLFVKSMGGGEMNLGPDPRWDIASNRETSRYHWIAPLVKAQPYISQVQVSSVKLPSVTHELSAFRELWHMGPQVRARMKLFRLFEAYSMRFGGRPLPEDQAWLSVHPVRSFPVVIHRSKRYRNDRFPWHQVAEMYRGQMLFVGLRDEYDDWTQTYGRAAEYHETENALEVAQLIAGSELFIGNQSSPMAIALGLNKQLVQEVCLWTPDCVFKRPNAHYFFRNSSIPWPKVSR